MAQGFIQFSKQIALNFQKYDVWPLIKNRKVRKKDSLKPKLCELENVKFKVL